MRNHDVIIISAGLGGLLTGALFSKAGKQILILEKLSFIGGRFTSRLQEGFEISTGAVHMIPHGSKGTLAKILHQLKLNCKIHDSNVLASFRTNNKHVIVRSILDLKKFLSLFSFREAMELIEIFLMMKLIKRAKDSLPFFDWLQRYTKSQRILRFFESVTNFGVGTTIKGISYTEIRSIVKNAWRHGMSGVSQGGCKTIINKLREFIESNGGSIKLNNEVKKIIVEDTKVAGVVCYDKIKGKELTIKSDLIISDVGPKDTFSLINTNLFTSNMESLQKIQETNGLKIHFSSEKSLINHTGIMFCLDTDRIAGIVQPSNTDPHLAPSGKHLLISFQILKSTDIKKEIELGINDLKHIFKKDFDYY